MDTSVSNHLNRISLPILVKETYGKLVYHRNRENRGAFNQELMRLMPHINSYVGKRLKAATIAGLLNKGMFSPNDFTDQLFIEVYDNWDEIKDGNGLRPFLFKKVDELLDKSLKYEEFDHLFMDNIDAYSQQEWDTMEEEFSTDGDGDLVMLEELDDPTFSNDAYKLDYVFVANDEKDLMEKLDKSLDKERIERHMDLVLAKMPIHMRSVYQLYTDQGFTANEIAIIRQTTLEDVEDLLSIARKLLKDSFVKRFLIDSN